MDTATDPQTYSRSINVDSDAESAIDEIRPEYIRNTIVSKAPEARFRLGTWSVIALVVNRVIGLAFSSYLFLDRTKFHRYWHLQLALDSDEGH